MKKTLLFTSIILAFTCFSCDDEPLDADIVIQNPSTGTPTNPTDPTDPTDPMNPNPTTGTLTTYTYDVNVNAPIFGEIITNTDFNIQGGIVTSQNIELTLFGFTENSLSTYTRNSNGDIILIQDNSGGSGQNTTTITYDGSNISQIDYDFSGDDLDDYTYNFTYNGNTVTKTIEGSTESAIFTFDSNSRIIKVESFDNGVSTQVETLTYAASGNCATSTVTVSGTSMIATYSYDAFSNPLKPIFADTYLLSVFNGEHEDEIAATIANFHSTNNWIGGTTSDGPFDFNPMYDMDNKIISKGGSYDLGDGVITSQSETFQY